jgi:hypothetical protein
VGVGGEGCGGEGKIVEVGRDSRAGGGSGGLCPLIQKAQSNIFCYSDLIGNIKF